MFVLDTNVISELMRSEPCPAVVAWLDARAVRALFVTAVTEAEVRTGIAFLPEGRRRRGLAESAERMFDGLLSFAGRTVLSFDSAAARACRTRKSRRAVAPLGVPSL